MQSFSKSVFQMMTDTTEGSSKVIEEWEEKLKIMEDKDDVKMENGQDEENKVQVT